MRYAMLTDMHQFVVRMDDALAAAVDALVADGTFESRSHTVRSAVEQLVDRHRRRRIGEAIVAGYQRVPETEEELAEAEANTRQLIAEEPW